MCRPERGQRASGLISVEAVGEVSTDGVRWHRVYLPGGQRSFQVHLDADGQPDECRFFSLLDEIVPSGSEEWAFWLDEGGGGDRLAGVPGARMARSTPGYGLRATRVLSTARAYRNADERYWHHEPGTAGDALRGSDRCSSPSPTDRVHAGRGSGPGRASLVEIYARIDVPVGMLQLS